MRRATLCANCGPTVRSSGSSSPPPSAEQKAARDAEEKRRAKTPKNTAYRWRKDLALLDAYASEAEIETVRQRALASRQVMIERSLQRLEEHTREKKKLDSEAEFYTKRADAGFSQAGSSKPTLRSFAAKKESSATCGPTWSASTSVTTARKALAWNSWTPVATPLGPIRPKSDRGRLRGIQFAFQYSLTCAGLAFPCAPSWSAPDQCV